MKCAKPNSAGSGRTHNDSSMIMMMMACTSLVNVILFRPPRPVSPYCFPSDVIRLETSRGNRICATSIKREGATIWLLVSHANAEDLNGAYRTMLKLSMLLDVNVIGYDYSGYGESTGA